jgi:hypothetical protein
MIAMRLFATLLILRCLGAPEWSLSFEPQNSFHSVTTQGVFQAASGWFKGKGFDEKTYPLVFVTHRFSCNDVLLSFETCCAGGVRPTLASLLIYTQTTSSRF